jgi:hypothetical protein
MSTAESACHVGDRARISTIATFPDACREAGKYLWSIAGNTL